MIISWIILKESKGLTKEQLTELYDGEDSKIVFSFSKKPKQEESKEIDLGQTKTVDLEFNTNVDVEMNSNVKLHHEDN